MAIARDTSINLVGGSSPQTISYTNNGNALIVFVGTDGTVSSVTYNGTALTQLEHTTTDYEPNSYLYALYPAPTGTANIVVTASGSTSCITYAASYSSTFGFGSHSSNHSAGASCVTDVTTTNATDWIAGALRTNSTPALSGGITNVQAPNSNVENYDTNGTVTVGTYSVGFSSGGRGCSLAVVLLGTSPVSPQEQSLTLTGVGS